MSNITETVIDGRESIGVINDDEAMLCYSCTRVVCPIDGGVCRGAVEWSPRADAETNDDEEEF